MFSTMNLAILAVGVLVVFLLLKMRRDQAAKGSAPKASKKAPGRKAPKAVKAGRRISAPKRGGGRSMSAGRSGRGRGRKSEQVAHELPAEAPHVSAPQAAGAYPAEPAMHPGLAGPVPHMAQSMPPQAAPGWQPAPVVAQPGWPTSPEQPQWGAPGAESLAYGPGQSAYADPGATGTFPTVGGPLADPGAAAAMVTNGNGAFPGVPSAPPAEWTMPAPDAGAEWTAPAAPNPHEVAPPTYADATPAAPQEWASWAPQGDGAPVSPVPDSVPEQWSQPAAPETPADESGLPALDVQWEQSSSHAPADAMPPVLADAHQLAQDWSQAPGAPTVHAGIPDSEIIYDDFGFPIEDAATLAPVEPAPVAQPAPSYEAPAPVAPAPEPTWDPPAAPAPVYEATAPVAVAPEPSWELPAAPAPATAAPVSHVELPIASLPALEPAVEWAPAEELSVAPAVEEFHPAPAPSFSLEPAVSRVETAVQELAVPAISMLHREPAPELAAPTPRSDDAWWDDAPAIVVPERSQQSGRFALGGHAIRAGQEALTGVTFREALIDEKWATASDANRAARIELTIEGSVNCASGGVEIVADPGFAPTEDGFTVRLVAEQSGPFMASGRYRVL